MDAAVAWGLRTVCARGMDAAAPMRLTSDRGPGTCAIDAVAILRPEINSFGAVASCHGHRPVVGPK